MLLLTRLSLVDEDLMTMSVTLKMYVPHTVSSNPCSSHRELDTLNYLDLVVKDISPARHFYGETLGFRRYRL